jgi:RNA polymerase sigma-B factor
LAVRRGGNLVRVSDVPREPSLRMRVAESGSRALLRLGGVADLATAPLLRAVLFQLIDEDRLVIVDAADLRLLDAASLGVLVAGHRRCAGRPLSGVWLCGAAGLVLRVVRIGQAEYLLGPDPVAPGMVMDRTTETLLRAGSGQSGDERSRVGLRQLAIRHEHGLAVEVAQRFRGFGEPVEDLVQVALLALIKAVDRYDPRRGVAFDGYAVPTIIGDLERHLREKCWHIRVPRRMHELGRRLPAARDELTQRLGHVPTIAALAAHLDTTEHDVLDAVKAARLYRPLSLSAPVNHHDHGGTVLADTIGGDDQRLDLVVDRESLRPLLAALPARQRQIILLRFVENLTQTEIAARVGLSQVHVSRLLADALHRLRRGLVPDHR